MSKNLRSTYRTHTCGELRVEHVGSEVSLSGWLHNRRDLGGVAFIELRDHYGMTQVVVKSDCPVQSLIASLPKETVIQVQGKVLARSKETVNPKLATGHVEVEVKNCVLLGSCEELPFSVFPEVEAPEDLRLKYRYLALRRSALHENVVLRAKIITSLRRRMEAEGFTEFQTPILTASSPEGARDFLVPSRMHPGKFYALPQAPQMFKQLLMIAGFDRYFQIAPCFRDEDARADRSPGEFYQLDVEMSFVEQEDVFKVIERVMHGVFTEFAAGKTVSAVPFPRIPYREVMLCYGTDKPDLRVSLRIQDMTKFFEKGEITVFQGKTIRALPVPTLSKKSRSYIDGLEAKAKELGAAGLAWLTIGDTGETKGPLSKLVPQEGLAQFLSQLEVAEGDGVLLIAHSDGETASKILGALRAPVAQDLGLVKKDGFEFCWITDFPMYERDALTGKVIFSHNPFSMPQGGLKALQEKDPLTIFANQYDLVCNGVELSSGAIRNHMPEVMYTAFEIAGYSRQEVDARFGGLIRSLKHGAPPHGGLAPGVDRIAMLLAEQPNIREVIAFPMNQKAEDLLMGAPCEVSPTQLKELHIALVKEGK